MKGVSPVLLVLAAACQPPTTGAAQLPDSSKDVWVFVVHGSGDGPERWAQPLVDTLSLRVKTPARVQWVAYDWRDAAKDKLSAAERGQAEGAAIAEVLESKQLSHVHVIAHSAGAHVAFGLEQALSTVASRPTLHLTLLDPFLGKGLDFEWGKTRFGTGADFVEQWLNLGDGVPGTETAVAAAHVFDVSKSAGKPEVTGSQGHWWPTQAYGVLEPGFSSSLEATGGFDAAALRERFPPGASEAVP
ncbi:MAG: alpha/beta fold hydrolase [Archangium sp.]|nr:alpha/beta fold hydrolase [Archangium sp.]